MPEIHASGSSPLVRPVVLEALLCGVQGSACVVRKPGEVGGLRVAVPIG